VGILEFVTLPSKAVISVNYNMVKSKGETENKIGSMLGGAEGFFGIRKL
jgi:hypothetical protein